MFSCVDGETALEVSFETMFGTVWRELLEIKHCGKTLGKLGKLLYLNKSAFLVGLITYKHMPHIQFKIRRLWW